MSMLYSSETPFSTSLLCSNGSSINCAPCYWSNLTVVPSATISDTIPVSEDPRTETLRRYSYGIALPSICLLGIIGNIFNLIVLTRRNMRGTAYIYMRGTQMLDILALEIQMYTEQKNNKKLKELYERSLKVRSAVPHPFIMSIIRECGYSAAALLAILFALPFAWRVLIHHEYGHWEDPIPAHYFAHLELFLGNSCLGIGVMMLLALTLERYVSVCHPGHARPILGSPIRAVILIPVLTLLFYAPIIFRSYVKSCRLVPDGNVIYQRTENDSYVGHPLYSIYKVVLELIFKVAPVILLAALNLRILIVYRRSCEKRRKMTLSRTTSGGEEDPRKFAEERRLVLLLGSTSILFLVCVTPMVILNVTLSDNNLMKYPYQVFRAIANLLEVTNYSITFYIYCLFSEDFRNTLLRTLSLRSRTPIGRGLLKAPLPTTTTTITTNNPLKCV